jgi:2-(1,2-epoxy-1,2-dihydrophenyl)acetyl-CoA isomerase
LLIARPINIDSAATFREKAMAAELDGASDPVLLEKLEDGVLTLTLNRPERLNALNVALHEALADAIRRAGENENCRVVILTGAGAGFCAGQDLGDRAGVLAGDRPDLGEAVEKRYNPLIRSLRKLPKPIVCAVNGAAAGAGANIALACDIVLAARSAHFLQAFARIGLVPDAGGTWFLPRLVGEARARALMMLAEPIGAEQAEAWGMIYRAVEDDQLMGAAHEIAARLAAGPTHAFKLMKRALAASSANSLDVQLDLERDLQREAGAAGEYVEGVRAFLEKRPANFRAAKAGA